MRQVPIGFTEEQYKQLKNESYKLGSSLASVVRLAIRDYFK